MQLNGQTIYRLIIRTLIYALGLMAAGCHKNKSDCLGTLDSALMGSGAQINASVYSNYLMGVLTFYTTAIHGTGGNSPHSSEAKQCQALVRIKAAEPVESYMHPVAADFQIFTSRQCLRPLAATDGTATPLWLSFFVDEDPTSASDDLKRPGYLIVHLDSSDFHQLALKRSEFSNRHQSSASGLATVINQAHQSSENQKLAQKESLMSITMMEHLWQSSAESLIHASTPESYQQFNQMFYTQMCHRSYKPTVMDTQKYGHLNNNKFEFVLRRLAKHSQPLGLGCYQAMDLTMFTAQAQLIPSQLYRIQSTAHFIPIAAKDAALTSPWGQFLLNQRFTHDLAVMDDLIADPDSTLAINELATEVAGALASVEMVPVAASVDETVVPDSSIYVVSNHHAVDPSGRNGVPLGVQTHMLSGDKSSPATGFYLHQTPWGLTAVQRIHRKFMDDTAPGTTQHKITYHKGALLIAHDTPVGVLEVFHDYGTDKLSHHPFTPFILGDEKYYRDYYSLQNTETDSGDVSDEEPPHDGKDTNPPVVVEPPVGDLGDHGDQGDVNDKDSTRSRQRNRRSRRPVLITVPPFPPLNGTPISSGVNVVSFEVASAQSSGTTTGQSLTPTPIQPPPALTTPNLYSPQSADSSATSTSSAAADECS